MLFRQIFTFIEIDFVVMFLWQCKITRKILLALGWIAGQDSRVLIWMEYKRLKFEERKILVILPGIVFDLAATKRSVWSAENLFELLFFLYFCLDFLNETLSSIWIKTDMIFTCHKHTGWKFRGDLLRKSVLESSISEFQKIIFDSWICIFELM